MYPRITVRYLPAVYGTFAVKFVASEDAAAKLGEVKDAFVLLCPKPFTASEQLTPEARKALVEVVQCASQKTRHRMCVVFGEQDCIFVEPDGTAKLSAEPPSGGIQCLRFPIRLKAD